MPAEVIGLGLATLDHLMVVDSFASPVSAVRVTKFDVQGGGMTASALVAASRLGAGTEIWSVAGTGRMGDWIAAGLEEEGVNVQCLRRVEGDGPLILVFVDVGTGERRFQVGGWPGRNNPPSVDLDRLEGARCLLVDGTWPETAAEAAAAAQSRGIHVVADLGGVGERNRELVCHVDFLIVDERCGRQVAGGDDFEKACRLLLEMGPKAVVVTLGPKGCVYADDGGTGRLEAFHVDVVDTTGAGDCFHGAFCAGLVQGRPFRRNVRFAAAAAAINCRSLGGRSGLPDLETVEAFLKERE